MRNFILGIIVTLVVLALGGLAFLSFGLMPTNADATPPNIETHIAMSAVDASMDRHAPKINNPVPPTDDNLIQGMKIYTMNCALCHGDARPKTESTGEIFLPASSATHSSSAGRSRVAHFLYSEYRYSIHQACPRGTKC